MNIENMTQTQIDALTAAASGTVTVVVPTVAGSPSYVPMAGMTLTVNGVKLVEGVAWTAGTSADATAEDIEDAINTATATTLCTAVATGPVVAITANTAGAAGNSISIGSNAPEYVFPSGATLLGGALPAAGALVFNSTTPGMNYFDGSSWQVVAKV
jgi:phage tail sheath gpL-like